MSALIGLGASLYHPGPAKLKRVTVTPRDGAIDSVKLFQRQVSTGEHTVFVKASAGVTIQAEFSDIVFPDGFTVVPTSTCESFIVEYE